MTFVDIANADRLTATQQYGYLPITYGGNFTITTVELSDGWVGQLQVFEKPIREIGFYESAEEARNEVQDLLVEILRDLFDPYIED